ncbi:MAG: hypothetical protein IPP79_15535 [Chitinophagaceae bacterium]|nr:hypothetical protein [Chitinophagaceae bacterium]
MRKLLLSVCLLLIVSQLLAQPNPKSIIRSNTQFNGYTNYWHDDYKNVYRYGNLFKMAHANVEKTIAQTKLNVADDIHLNGLDMQEGFVNFLLQNDYKVAWNLSSTELNVQAAKGNLLVVLEPNSEQARIFNYQTRWREQMKSHQMDAVDFADMKAFVAQVGKSKAAVIITSDKAQAQRLIDYVAQAKNLLSTYTLRKGWFGAESLLKSVTCTQGHPLETIGRGMNEGNSFFTFNGYMDFMAQDELDKWVKKSGLPIVADVGFAPMFGLKNYEHLQVQDMPNRKAYVDYAHSKGGYVFRNVWDPEADTLNLPFDGYTATEGNKEQVDKDNTPFIVTTGTMDGDLINSMLLFVDKGVPFTKEVMWKAILARRSVAVLDQAKMMGSEQYRATAALLYLDRVYLENYFGDKVDIQTEINGYVMDVTITNFSDQPLNGQLSFFGADALSFNSKAPAGVMLPAMGQKTIRVILQPNEKAMGQTNPIAINFKWGQQQKAVMAMLDLPPAISVHRLLFGHAPNVDYPVTIHNFTKQHTFPVKLEVFSKTNPGTAVYTTTSNFTVTTSKFQKMNFNLPLSAGHYNVKVSALGVDYTSQLGVEGSSGSVSLREEDFNKDGVPEFVMENDQVRVTLLATGARVIEYFVKSRNDNILFKLWPEKAEDDRRTFRKRGYYPYGGFEDFLGQGSMETHKVYKAEIVKKDGEFVQVKMTADYYGNEIQKIFTLYGNTPLLEVRFALTFKNPEANVLGPQPILELGKVHGPEDLFVAPTIYGLEEYRMRMEDYYGRVIKLKEGWNAGYDTKQDISFVGAYPVDQPLFLHMWMNHPRNSEAHYYYTEFQPWTPIIQKTTMYFSYYIWGAGGSWGQAVQALRDRNLITTQK